LSGFIERPISAIGWFVDGVFTNLEVGRDEITHIDAVEQYLGEYSIIWVQIWKNNKLVARYNARNLDSIDYEEIHEDH